VLARSNNDATVEIRDFLVMETTTAVIFYPLFNKHSVHVDHVS
jgi:N-acetylglutamate synthase-like GNAT family acetyltransferase